MIITFIILFLMVLFVAHLVDSARNQWWDRIFRGMLNVSFWERNKAKLRVSGVVFIGVVIYIYVRG